MARIIDVTRYINWSSIIFGNRDYCNNIVNYYNRYELDTPPSSSLPEVDRIEYRTLEPSGNFSDLNENNVIPQTTFDNTFSNNTAESQTIKTPELVREIVSTVKTTMTDSVKVGTKLSIEWNKLVIIGNKINFEISTEFTHTSTTENVTTKTERLIIPAQTIVIPPYSTRRVKINLSNLNVSSRPIQTPILLSGIIVIKSLVPLPPVYYYDLIQRINNNCPNAWVNSSIGGPKPYSLDSSRQGIQVAAGATLSGTIASYQYTVDITTFDNQNRIIDYTSEVKNGLPAPSEETNN